MSSCYVESKNCKLIETDRSRGVARGKGLLGNEELSVTEGTFPAVGSEDLVHSMVAVLYCVATVTMKNTVLHP